MPLPPPIRALIASMLALATASAHALDADKRFHHYVRDTWSIDQGLPQISALAIAQGAEGYVWVGTQAGLARFDGVRFVSFDPQNTPELPGILVQSLLADRQGTLWVGTYKGLARYRARRFETVALRGNPGAGLDVRDILQTQDDRILVATASGVFEVADDALVPHARLPVLPAYGLLGEPGALWVASEGGVLRLDASGIRMLDLPAAEQPVTVTRLARAQGRLWAGTSRGLFFLEDDAWRRFDLAAPASGPVDALYVDRDQNFWVASHEALLRLREGRVVERIEAGSSAAPRAVRALHEDREGSLWLGSQWDGVTRVWNGRTVRHSTEEGLADPIVWSIARDPDGTLWVGGNDGLSRFDGERFEAAVGGDALPHPNAYTLLPEPGQLWIGTRRGLVRLRDGRIDAPPAFAALAHTQVNGLLRVPDGALWIASMDGLFRWQHEELARFGAAEGLEDPRVRLVLRTRDGTLLAATQNGLLRIDGERLLRVGADEGLPTQLDITALHQLPDGSLLAGTLSEQLFHFDGERWFEFNESHGMPVNSPFFITHDSKGWVWIAGIRGVSRVRLEQLLALRRGERERVDGEMLLSERGDKRGSQKGFCCNGAGLAKGFIEDDTLWLPTRGGVVTLGSDGASVNTLPPPVLVERVRHSGTWWPLTRGERIDLPSHVRDIAFEFTVLSFQQPGSVGLRYRLRGYDADWHVVEDVNRRDAVYTNLPPGPYVFEVSGANNALVWNPEPARLHFSIAPRLHETPWFYALVALVLVGFGIGVQHLRTRSLVRRQQELESLVAQRTDALAAANDQLQHMIHTDTLTLLRNRRFLQSQLPADLSFYLREMRKPGNEGMVMMLALVDIDHFKLINDLHGHRAGDLVLQQFARLLERQVRSGDYVVRWGGEEFLLVFRPMPVREATKIAERIRHAIDVFPFDIDSGEPLHVTASLGFVEYPLFREEQLVPDWERMVELADRALYAVKASGRNGWATFRPAQPMPLEALLEALRDDVDRALASGRVELIRSPPVA